MTKTIAGPAAESAVAEAGITDDDTLNPGSLTVTKTINGAGAGQQGQSTIVVSCIHGDATVLVPPLVIPARQPVGIATLAILLRVGPAARRRFAEVTGAASATGDRGSSPTESIRFARQIAALRRVNRTSARKT